MEMIERHHGSVVCYGHDKVLLATRLLILDATRAMLSPVTDDASFRSETLRLLPQVIILCQSLSKDECLEAADFAAVMSPLSAVLVMVNKTNKCGSRREHFELNSGEPKRFLETVVALLAASDRKANPLIERSARHPMGRRHVSDSL